MARLMRAVKGSSENISFWAVVRDKGLRLCCLQSIEEDGDDLHLPVHTHLTFEDTRVQICLGRLLETSTTGSRVRSFFGTSMVDDWRND